MAILALKTDKVIVSGQFDQEQAGAMFLAIASKVIGEEFESPAILPEKSKRTHIEVSSPVVSADKTEQVERALEQMDEEADADPDPGREDNPFVNDPTYQRPYVVVYRCPICKEVSYRRLTLAQSNKENCFKCGEEFSIMGARSAKITCPNDGERYMVTIAGDLREINCRICQSPIDLIEDKEGQLISANVVDMMRRRGR